MSKKSPILVIFFIEVFVDSLKFGDTLKYLYIALLWSVGGGGGGDGVKSSSIFVRIQWQMAPVFV